MHDTALKLAQDLIRCPSVTPKTEGVYDVLTAALEPMGFECHILTFGEDGKDPVTNLFARYGRGQPHFCFAGHVDVVPVGDTADWSSPPFDAAIVDNRLYGRGTSDMKGAVAAFIAAVQNFIEDRKDFDGSISLLIAGDEEDPQIAGTKHVLKWLEDRGEIPDMCLVGEPTNPNKLGQMIKIGRRGSLTGRLSVQGVQGHAAYPHLADNPVPKMVDLLAALKAIEFDTGSDFFQATNLEIVSIDTGNTADNVIPARLQALFNIRFNDLHASTDIIAQIDAALKKTGHPYSVAWQCSGESFLTQPGFLSDTVARAVEQATGIKPDLTTTGGTSDARFISQYCPVVEFGGVGQTMHKVDENILLDDLYALTDIYGHILKTVFEK